MRAFLVALCFAVLSGCLAPPPEDPPVTIAPPPPPPPLPPPVGPPPPPPFLVCGRTKILDTGGHGGFPGSGLGQDGGTGQLWLVRIDRGTANLAQSIQTLIQRTTGALRDARLSPRGIAVVSLYDGALIWSTRDVSRDPLNTVATLLGARAALDNPAPAWTSDGGSRRSDRRRTRSPSARERCWSAWSTTGPGRRRSRAVEIQRGRSPRTSPAGRRSAPSSCSGPTSASASSPRLKPERPNR